MKKAAWTFYAPQALFRLLIAAAISIPDSSLPEASWSVSMTTVLTKSFRKKSHL